MFVIALAVVLAALPLSAHPEIEDALNRLNARIAAAPEDADLYLQRGELYARHEDWITAEANFLRATELSPRHPRLDPLRGALALAAGRPAEARTFLNAALARTPANPELLVLRARAHAALLNRHAAVTDFNAAFAQLTTPPPELFLERAALLAPADAIRSLDEGLERLGPVISLQLRAIELEESLGHTDRAVARIDQLAAQSERKEIWLKRRGDLLARAGRHDAARAAYLAARTAIAALPEWLRQSPETSRLDLELARLTQPRA